MSHNQLLLLTAGQESPQGFLLDLTSVVVVVTTSGLFGKKKPHLEVRPPVQRQEGGLQTGVCEGSREGD